MSNLEEREIEQESNEPLFTKPNRSSSGLTGYGVANSTGGLLRNPYQYPYPDVPELFSPLVIEPEKLLEMYNLDIEPFVERHTFREKAQSKGGDSPVIKYMSWSHAVRLFRQNFPGFEVCCVMNPETQSYIFREIDDRGYFIKSYIHNGKQRSEYVYFAVLSTSGSTVYPNDKDSRGNYIGNSQLFNKSYYRAIVKAIAFTTFIGLKLWTGDDLGEQILDAKLNLISKVKELADKYLIKFGVPYVLPVLDYNTSETEIKRIGKELTNLLKQDNLPSKDAIAVREVAVVSEPVLQSKPKESVTIVTDDDSTEIPY